MPRLPFREQVLRAREEAILDSVSRHLAEKGFDLMTVDQVAAEVGIAKASLYKHFVSKEALAAAAVTRLLQRALGFIDQPRHESGAPRSAAQGLRDVVRWVVGLQLAGEVPLLPSRNSPLRAELLRSRDYLDRLMAVSERLGAWIEQAQAEGDIDPALPPEVVLYTIYARACDPVPGLLKAGGSHSDEAIVDWVANTCLDGLRSR